MYRKNLFLIPAIIIIAGSISNSIYADSGLNFSFPGYFGTLTSKQLYETAKNNNYETAKNNNIDIIQTALAPKTASTLKYTSYVYTPSNIVIFSYEDGTSLEVYNSAGNPVSFQPNVLNKGQHASVNTSMGTYFVAGSNKFSVLTGDELSGGALGYGAMDANGKGLSKEFYTYVPSQYGYNLFIVFGYQDGTNITVQEEISSGVYADIASFTLDKGKHWATSVLASQYLHVTADKPVAALTCYDQSYFVPTSNTWWSGKEFYTYVGNMNNWPQDLTVMAYNDNTAVSVRDSDSNELIWQGTLNSGQYYVKSYFTGANKYFTIISSDTATVSVQPWATSSGYVQGTFIQDKEGCGTGTDLIGSAISGGYMKILAYMDNTQVDVNNSGTGALYGHYVLNAGESVSIAPGGGIWRIRSDKDVSVYSGSYNYSAQASFSPLIFNKPGGLTFTKVCDVNEGDCVVPDREINYTINYEYRGAGDSNVSVLDYLPAQVDYNSSIPAGDYNAAGRTVAWNIGTVPANGSGTITVKCIVNYAADPCSTFTNTSAITGNSTNETAEVNTSVCYWNTIIYVDHNAPGANSGFTWRDAYRNLQGALDRAATESHCEIWVARGTYLPSKVYQGYPTFQLVNDVPLYGHFKGDETSILLRDLNDNNNETILSGLGVGAVYVVTASGTSQKNLIDNFTIKRSTGSFPYACIRIENAYLNITNCLITQSSGNGIYSVNSGFTISNSIIANNNYRGISGNYGNLTNLPQTLIKDSVICDTTNYEGIFLTRVSSPVVIENCNIYNNRSIGISIQQSALPVSIRRSEIFNNRDYGISLYMAGFDINNCWVYHNIGTGIYLNNPTASVIRNNTVVKNTSSGIYRWMGTAPAFSSCIVSNNTSTDTYNCDGNNIWRSTKGDPCFVNIDANDFHLKMDSNCIDAGDPNFTDANDKDIDGQSRIMFGKSANFVDIGADEFVLIGDFDHNGKINFVDYSIWSTAWETGDSSKSLDGDNDIDIDDLAKFGEYWLFGTP